MLKLLTTPADIQRSAEADHAISRRLLDRVAAAEDDEALRIWAPVPSLALSRLDQLRDGADAAAAAASAAGFEVVRRVSGGRAVVLGRGSFCVGLAERAHTFEGTQERYERLGGAVIAAFTELGVPARHGELAGEWCPGAWSIHSGTVKLAGLAQRALKGAAWVEAVIDLAPDPDARELLIDVYEKLGVELNPATIGSVEEVRGRPAAFEDLAALIADRV